MNMSAGVGEMYNNANFSQSGPMSASAMNLRVNNNLPNPYPNSVPDNQTLMSFPNSAGTQNTSPSLMIPDYNRNMSNYKYSSLPDRPYQDYNTAYTNYPEKGLPL